MSSNEANPRAKLIPPPSGASISAPHLKWGDGLDAGFQVLPDVLLKNQKALGLSPLELVVLINLTMAWWYRDRLPFPSSITIARRMGTSARTVQRAFARLSDLGLVVRVQAEGSKRAHFDMSGLREALVKLAHRDPGYRPRLRNKLEATEVQTRTLA